MKTIAKFLPDPFVTGLFCMMAIAYVFPQASHSTYFLPQISQIGIWCIFFFYGLKIPKATLISNISRWPLHLAIQLTTFLAFPVLIWMIKPYFLDGEREIWWKGFWFLAALPSTVSSSVVMVGMARGNVPGALFNATLSGLIGVLITPLWISGGIQSETLGTMYWGLFLEVILPTLLGILLQPWGAGWVQKRAKNLAWMDKTTIWIIVYLSFAETFTSSIWTDVSSKDLLYVAFLTLCIFIFFLTFIFGLNRWFSWFSAADEITWMFCGSKKSLVHGSVFLPLLFPGQVVGLVLFPLMIYHAWQLIIVSYLAAYFEKKEPSLN